MIINNFNIVWSVHLPHEADTILLIDAYAMLPFAVAF